MANGSVTLKCCMIDNYSPKISNVNETLYTDKGICGRIQRAEKNDNHRTNVRLLDMLKEVYAAVGQNYGIKESSVRCIKK